MGLHIGSSSISIVQVRDNRVEWCDSIVRDANSAVTSLIEELLVKASSKRARRRKVYCSVGPSESHSRVVRGLPATATVEQVRQIVEARIDCYFLAAARPRVVAVDEPHLDGWLVGVIDLALLCAVGLRVSTVHWLVFSEHALLLALGLIVGTLSALVAVLPALRTPGAEVPFLSLALTLGAVLASGFLWTWGATSLALRGPLLSVLRND